MAPFRGKPLILHAAEALAPHVDALVVAGRDWSWHEGPVLTPVADAPRPGLGPLGGLCGALLHAAHHGYDTVLSCGCDTLWPDGERGRDLLRLLQPAPAACAELPVVGLWPASLAAPLLDWLNAPGSHAVYGFVDVAGVRLVPGAHGIANINRPEDLAQLDDGSV